FLIEQVAVKQRLLDRLAELVERLLRIAHLVETICALEAAVEQIIGKRAEQVLHAHLARRVGNIFGVGDALHRSSLVQRPSGPRKWRLLHAVGGLRAARLLFSGGEDALLAAPDALVRP